jgi:Zn-finger nucleic acid-binding protein
MALFERRRYFFCEHCGTFHFIDAPAVDGVQVLERREDRRCPRCEGSLAASLLDGQYAIESCERCRGVLLSRAAFADALNRRRARAAGPGVPPEPVDRRELDRRATCPQCASAMDVHPYYGPGNVVIDSCTPCALIWLDYGELQQITDAPGRDRGRPLPPRSFAFLADDDE